MGYARATKLYFFVSRLKLEQSSIAAREHVGEIERDIRQIKAVTRPPHVKPFLNLNYELNIQDLIWCLPPFTFSLVCLNTT